MNKYTKNTCLNRHFLIMGVPNCDCPGATLARTLMDILLITLWNLQFITHVNFVCSEQV